MHSLKLLLAVFVLSCAGLQAQQPYLITARKVFDVRNAVDDSILQGGDRLGASLTSLGSFPTLPAGTTLMAAGLRGADNFLTGEENTGAVWLLSVRPNGQMNRLNTIAPQDIPELGPLHGFGESVANIGDLDGDGLPELAVGAAFDPVGGSLDVGSVYICFLDSVGELRTYTRITNGAGGLPAGLIPSMSRFGSAIAQVGDLDGNGVNDIAVSAPYDNIGGMYSGGVLYLLFLDASGGVINYRAITSLEPILNGRITNGDFFGSGLAWLGNIGSSSAGVLAVGAWGADAKGRVHLLSFTPSGIVNRNIEIGSDLPLLSTVLDPGDAFGFAIAPVGDLNGDGITELAVSAPGDDDSNDGLQDKGAVYLLFLQSDGFPLLFNKISEVEGGLGVSISSSEFFGSAVASAGDVDQDGIPDLVIGARNKATDGVRTGNFFLSKQLYCRIPGNPLANAGGPTSVSFTWDNQPGARGYLVQTRVSGTAAWSNYTTASNILTVDTLEPGETYDWRVYTGCGPATSFGSAVTNITLPTLRTASLQPLSNPVQGELVLQLSAGQRPEDSRLRIWSYDGRLMHQQIVPAGQEASTFSIAESSHWPNGLYWMEWRSVEGLIQTYALELLR
ncbi:MAG: hypothetical protein GC205_08875 [Bacteroidetes bacterium]|nr:hypothetical protein [Bacteroidota bacterium]